MVARKLRSAMLCLLMCSLSTREYNAQTNEEADETRISLTHQQHYTYNINVELVSWDNIELSSIAERKLLRGRRSTMALVNHGPSLSSRKCSRHMKGELDVECELSDVVPSTVNLVGRMPFTSDYHNPRTHPPKNN